VLPMKGFEQDPRLVLLLVEDDINAVDLFKLVFRKIAPNWQLIHCGNGLEATRFMMDNPMPDLIVTDLQMPKMTGQELIAWVRANISGPRVPIMVLSSRSEPGLGDELLELGADDYICKFSSLTDLKRALQRHTSSFPEQEPITLVSHRT
jgi:CheY-like chemotaxis protein